jgi:3-phenylpropionate/trans-cinnamate dioxygenase ferredoxin reductase subunit
MTTARGMLGLPADYADVPWLWSDQYGVNVQILGLRSPESRCVRRSTGNASAVYFYLDGESRLCQMVSFGDARAIKLGRRWMAREQVLDEAVLADPQFDLMALR